MAYNNLSSGKKSMIYFNHHRGLSLSSSSFFLYYYNFLLSLIYCLMIIYFLLTFVSSSYQNFAVLAHPTTSTSANILKTESIFNTSLQSTPNDGAKSSDRSNSIDSTTVTDIRKLLEDYVQYLASLPNINKINNNNNDDDHQQQQQMKAKTQQDIISMAESNERIVHPTIKYNKFVPVINQPNERDVSSNNDEVYEITSHVQNIDDQNQLSIVVPNGFAIPIEPGITLSLNDEELNSFIENVLGTIKENEEVLSNKNITSPPPIPLFEQVSNVSSTKITNNNNQSHNNKTATDDKLAIDGNVNLNNIDHTKTPQNISLDTSNHLDYLTHGEKEAVVAIVTPYEEPTTTDSSNIFHDESKVINGPLPLPSSSSLLGEIATIDGNKSISEEIESSIDKEFHFNGEESLYALQELTTTPPILEDRSDEDTINTTTTNGNDGNNVLNENQMNKNNYFLVDQPQPAITDDKNRYDTYVGQIDLLEQLKRTKELLNIHIEKLKTLEKSMFRRKSVLEHQFSPLLSNDHQATDATERIIDGQNTESSLFMATTSGYDIVDRHQDYQMNESTYSTSNSQNDYSMNSNHTSLMLTSSEYIPTTINETLSTITTINTTTVFPFFSDTISKNIDDFKTITTQSTNVTDNDNDDNVDIKSHYETTAVIPSSFYTSNNDNDGDNNEDDGDEEIFTLANEDNEQIHSPKELIQLENVIDSNISTHEKIPINNNIATMPTKQEQDFKKTSGRLIINTNVTNYNNFELPLLATTSTKKLKDEHDDHHHDHLLATNLNVPNIIPINSTTVSDDAAVVIANVSSGTISLKDERNSVLILSASGFSNPNSSNYGDNNDPSATETSNNNNKNESNNIETMILTHVPKITIIHKIMKPYRMAKNGHDDKNNDNNKNNNDIQGVTSYNGVRSANNNNFDENHLYRDTLRKHQDLIRSTMSSMSLYPALFKRYKTKNGNNNRINSVGEIYLLPNFFINGSTKPVIQFNSTSTAIPVITTNLHQKIHDNSKSANSVATFSLASENSETFINGNDKHNNNQIITNEGEEEIKKTKKKSFDNRNKNKEENKLMHRNIYARKINNKNKFNIPNVYELELDVNNNNNNNRKTSMKLLLNYHTIWALNRNPENILKLYRPRFKHRKRFRKVRLPIGYRLAKKDKVSLVPVNEKMAPTTTTFSPTIINGINRLIESDIQNAPNDYLTTTLSPPETLFTSNNDIIKKIDSYREQIKQESSTISPSRIVIADDESISNNQKMSNTSNIIAVNSLVNNNNIYIRNHSTFKIFCTYDAHLLVPSNNPEMDGRFFDINKLERNSAILKQCTYLVYAFANVDLNGELYTGLSTIHQDNTLREHNKEITQAFLIRLQNLKQSHPHLRILAAVGGWDTPPQLFSLMVATAKLRDRLSVNIHKFILENGFDGAIISWFYPVYGTKSSLDSRSTRATSQSLFQLDDKQNLIKFVRTLRKKFDSIGVHDRNKLEIGLMVPPFQEFIDRGYDAKKLAQSVDHLILMTYDYYGSWENQVNHFAPLYARNNKNINHLFDDRNEKFNINYTVNYWINHKGAPRNQTSIGVAFYGRSFTLANQSDAHVGSLATGPGIAGPITNRPGLLSFNELCELYLGNPNVQLREDEYRITANLQLFDQWVGFDDELSLYLKTKYAIGNQLSGIFIWSINYDDYKNRCGWGPFPLLTAVNKAVEHCTLWRKCSSTVLRPNITTINGNTNFTTLL